jgi:ribosomal protein L23
MNIQRPIITEKSLGLASRGWYTFAVGKHVRKERAAKEIEIMYHVHVTKARTVAMHGKVRRTGKKMVTKRRADWKKIMVLLKSGEHIDAFEVTTKEEPAKAEKPVEKVEEQKTETKKLETQKKGKVKK